MERLPTLVFWPGESHGQRSLAGYSPQDCKEPNTTEKLTLSLLTTLKFSYILIRVSLVVQMVKNLPAMQETRIQSLGWEDPLGKEMATHSSTLAWKIPWMEDPVRL